MQDLEQREIEFQNIFTQLNYHNYVAFVLMINSCIIGTDTLAGGTSPHLTRIDLVMGPVQVNTGRDILDMTTSKQEESAKVYNVTLCNYCQHDYDTLNLNHIAPIHNYVVYSC